MSLFGNKIDIMEGTLKNPNELREAFIFNSIASKGKDKINSFVNSNEAKVMIEEGLITYDLLDRLSAEEMADKELELSVCHMASENDDPQWNELVAVRAQERRIMNDLLDKYAESARVIAKESHTKFLDHEMPKEFK